MSGKSLATLLVELMYFIGGHSLAENNSLIIPNLHVHIHISVSNCQLDHNLA